MLALFFCMATRIDKPQHAIRCGSVAYRAQWEVSGQCNDRDTGRTVRGKITTTSKLQWTESGVMA